MQDVPDSRFYSFAPIGYLVLDGAGVIIAANKAACESLGYRKAELEGKAFRELASEPDFSIEQFLVAHAAEGYVEKAPLSLRQHGGATIQTLVNARVEGASVLLVFDDVTERERLAAERERLIAELEKALAQIETLTGMLPICANCKKVRTDTGEWQAIESYIRERTRAEFSHGICPQCVEQLYPGYAARLSERGG